jgi:hypothetical protein
MMADTSDALPDRRRHLRFPAHVPLPCWVKVQGHREGTPPQPGQLRNVSEGGALLDLQRRIPPGAMLAFTVETKVGLSEVEAEVIWATAGPPTGEGPSWIHGLRFTAPEGGVPDPVIESLVRLYARATFERPEPDAEELNFS